MQHTCNILLLCTIAETHSLTPPSPLIHAQYSFLKNCTKKNKIVKAFRIMLDYCFRESQNNLQTYCNPLAATMNSIVNY